MKKVTRKEAREKGLKRYYTGEPCIYGHVAERSTINTRCLECGRLSSAKQRECPEFRKQQAEYKSKWSKDKIAHDEAWHNKRLEQMKEWNAAPSARKSKNEWKKRNPEQSTLDKHRRRARKVDNLVALTEQESEAVRQIARDRDELNYMCPFNDGFFHVDHIVPVAKGGSNHPDNLQLLLDKENYRKGAKL